MKSRWLTILLLPAALICYLLGMAVPATALLVIGAVLELAFWVRLFRRDRSDSMGQQ